MPWTNKRVMITGVAGTVGQELLRQLLQMDLQEIVGIDNNESELFFLEQAHLGQKNVEFVLCDIQDSRTLENLMRGCDIVLHSAAYKHVPLCEKAPRSSIMTNIIGVENVIEAAFKAGVKKVLFTSSDKAVNPTNVMGTSKLMGERLITAANQRRQENDPVFAVTRFGNVLGSRGSVIPLFKKQIAAGGPVTVTHQDMTRFIMTLEDAVRLVLDSALLFKGGEVFITKMPVIRIIDLAQVMINELAPAYGYSPKEIELRVTEPRPGEKLYEELLNGEEVRRSLESDRFFIVKPAFEMHSDRFTYEMKTEKAVMPYTSETSPYMGQEELRDYLYQHNLISAKEQDDGTSDKEAKLRVVK